MLLFCLFLFLNLKYVISIRFLTDKRYLSPMPIERWTGVVDGRNYYPCCLSVNVTTISREQDTIRGEEDCLYLTVYTPKEPSKSPYKDTLPVMMYVHGGGFITGCGGGLHLLPDLFAENVVFVIPNFRVGVFGYLSTEDMECTGNWGIKDLFAALKWIQRNIKRFGGNRRKVTIMGHSSGAVNVNVILMSPKANGLIHRAILMSGSSLSFWAYRTNPKKVAFDVGETVDIKTNSTKVLIEELRKIPADRLIDLQRDFVVKNSMNAFTSGLPFTPSIEPQHSEAVWTSGHAYELFERGRFNVIPVMLGVTSLEFLTFSSALKDLKAYTSLLDRISSKIFTLTNDPQNKSIIAQKIKNYFFKSNSFEGATNLELLEILSEHAFRRPMRKTAELIARCSPTYFYQFSYESAFGYSLIKYLADSEKRIEKGVGHAEDAAYLFDFCHHFHWPFDHRDYRNPQRTDQEIEMSKKLAKIYTNFAKFGNPTPEPDSFLDNISWPEVTADNFPYVNIDFTLEVRENFNEERFRFWEDLIKKYGKKPYVVY